MRRLALVSLVSSAVLLAPAAGRAQTFDLTGVLVDLLVDGGNAWTWEKVQLPGATCGNGTPYKFFVHATGSPNVLLYFQGGGACWDYDTCSGRAGVLGAANPNGIPDDFMSSFLARYVSPIVNGADPGLAGVRSRKDLVTKGWNVVFMPYCTGDVHSGNNVVTYTDPAGVEPPLTWHHAGYTNTLAALDWLHARFPAIGKLLVSGYSAGGTATSSTYWFARTRLAPQKGYLLNDSGPIFPAPSATDHSRKLHDKIRQSWALDSVFAQLPGTFDTNDFGSINRVVALAFPNDRLAYTGYTRDYNYSRFSYERFLTPNDEAALHAYWLADQNKLVAELGKYPNFSWFIPYHRPINDSHCDTIITFIGSHACQQMLKKKYFWEYLEWPWGQTYKCYSEFVPMETFLQRFVAEDRRVRINEPANAYNVEDPGMKLVAPLINGAIDG